jgi:hypothetical protein
MRDFTLESFDVKPRADSGQEMVQDKANLLGVGGIATLRPRMNGLAGVLDLLGVHL